MRRISTMQLIPGMITAEDVFSYEKQLLIAKGIALTENVIAMLDMHDITNIRIEDAPPVVPASQTEESTTKAEKPASSLSYYARLRNSPQFRKFKVTYDDTIVSFKSQLKQILYQKESVDINKLYNQTVSILPPDLTTFGILDYLQNMREYDDYVFSHSLNVSIISNVLARWVKLSEEEIRLVTAAALLHDIGKLLIPLEILQKPGKLSHSEYEKVQKHTSFGYQLLSSQGVDKRICNAILMHHERCDGSGYPLRLVSRQIDPIAKIIAVADVYDAMTATRVYHGPICPFKVIEMFEQEGLQKYDPLYIMTFMRSIVDIYISNRCRLSNGQEGDIIFINKDKLSHPTVQCGKNYVNLSEQMDLHIECLL